MNAVYRQLGISKQAVHQRKRRQAQLDIKWYDLMDKVDALRKAHPGCGVEKMYYTLNPDFIGRDRFIEACMACGYGLKRKRNYRKTTYPGKKYFPNLIGGLKVNGPNQVWQSDITYFGIGGKHYYGVFIIDVYTKKIVGHSVSEHMLAIANVAALKKALKHNTPPSYHHSDRGSQYGSKHYTSILEKNNVAISMGKLPQDNAFAERINRTIKEEYIEFWEPSTLNELRRCVNKAVKNYNTERIHNNLQRTPPSSFEELWSSNPNKPVLTIFEYQ